MMQIKAQAKVNLYLQVGARRADGYHDIRTIFHSISLADTLTIEAADTIEVLCSAPEIPSGPGNLAHRAGVTLAERSGIRRGARVTIRKEIPSQAGLGGGSADAAAALVGLNEFWRAGASLDDLEMIGAGLGADVPFCVRGGAAYAEGVGERLFPLPPLPEEWMVVLKPAAAISTRAAYEALDRQDRKAGPPPEEALRVVREGRIEALASVLYNDFEPAALEGYPEILKAHRALQARARGVLLCGSGAALFGLVGSESTARAAAEVLGQEGWEAWPARFVPGRAREG